MALFGAGKKKEGALPAMGMPPQMPETPAPPTGTPVEQVLSLQKQGMSNYQVVQTLQQQGFSSQQIYDAMNQAAIKGGVNPPLSDELPPPEGMPAGGPPIGQQFRMPPQQQMPPMPMPAQSFGSASAGIEETVEAVVEEKWREISATIAQLNEWKESVDSRMSKFEQAVKDLQSDMDNLHKALVAKIGEYDQNILSVGTEIKAMEKVFSKVLPQFTENVNELARVAKGIKSSAKK